MNKILKNILPASGIAALALFTPGCAQFDTVNNNVPHSSFAVDLDGHKMQWDSPKDTVVTNLNLTVGTNGVVALSIGYLSSQGNTNMVDATAQVVTAQGQATVNAINAINTLVGSSVKAAQ